MDGDREFAGSATSSGTDGDGAWGGGPGLVASLWRYRLVIVAVAAIAAVAGYAASLLLPTEYSAQAKLFLHDPGSPAVLTLAGTSQSSQSGDHAVFMAQQAEFAGSDVVYGRATQLLEQQGTPDHTGRSVEVTPSGDLAFLTVRATSSDSADAVDLANAIGTAYQQLNSERITADSENAIAGLQQVVAQRQAEFDALQVEIARASAPEQVALQRKAVHVSDLIGALQVHQNEIAAQAALYGSGVEAFEEAVPPASSSQLSPSVLALMGAAVGFVTAGGWAWWAAGRNRRVEADDDAAAILGVPLLGGTPRLGGKLRGLGGPSSPPDALDPVAAEAYHFVLTSLEHALSRKGGKVVAVASARPGDGKTVTVLNLALAAKREGRNVLLVDADERTRRLTQLCRDGGHFDVIGMSQKDAEGPDVAEQVALAGEASAGPPSKSVPQIGLNERNGQHHPAGFFRSRAFGKLISFSSEPADLVLIDTPALLGVSEAVTIADQADAVLLVVNRGTPLADLRRARERLAFTDTPLIGYMLNRGAAGHAYGTGAVWGSRARGLLHRRGAGVHRRRRPVDLRTSARPTARYADKRVGWNA
ncbi:Wzz/FepE/Etk N-terminal domain-containing protein [Geodermatophilus sp. SYSU D01180]